MPALYVHVPFCRRKCPYCDFFSVTGASESLEDYPDLLCRHLNLARGEGWRGPFETVFFGGGTPSLLPPTAVARVLEAAAACFGIGSETEVSLEANPGTVSLGTLAGYRAAGVNRLSLGIQSLNAAQLRRLGRIHDPAAARRAVAAARRAGFDNLSCDLIFALPGQTQRALRDELEAFLDLQPDHLACYGLTIEEGTPFAEDYRAGNFSIPLEEEYASLYEIIAARMTAAGFHHYEISNFARPGRECRHNLRYWRRRGYLGIGPGAHSFCSAGYGARLAVPPDLPRYRAVLATGESPTVSLETFDRAGAMAETLYLGLRTTFGIAEQEFRDRFGVGVAAAFPEAVARCREHLRLTDGIWHFDRSGWLLYDHLIASFL